MHFMHLGSKSIVNTTFDVFGFQIYCKYKELQYRFHLLHVTWKNKLIIKNIN